MTEVVQHYPRRMGLFATKEFSMIFLNADLHVHSPKSICYRKSSVTDEQIVDAARQRGLDILAVTDHNSVEGVDGIRTAARGKGLLVFPGIELSTSAGHFITLFDLDRSADDLRRLVENIGLPQSAWGDAAAAAAVPIAEILDNIHQCGGLVIAAHAERWPTGFLETNLARGAKLKIHNHPCLDALEITVPQNKTSWNAGSMRGYSRKIACIQSSDAHAPEEIGRRFVRINMRRENLDGLRSALIDYDERILFPDVANGADPPLI